ncbi:MAG TPA: hypothetical protein VES68_04100 [Candidatus Sulfotelmatobacter sp.]|nr:hypothetical protein [Candidatus Sulfotelmatobacter sp.]
MTAEEFIKLKEEKFQNSPEITVKDIKRDRMHKWTREAWTFLQQSDYPGKVFTIERLRLDDKLEYRFGYYIVSEYGRTKGKWVWGQFSPFIPAKDLNKLLEKAKRDGTII